MKYLSAYLLLALGGNAAPTAEDIKKVIAVTGAEADDEKITLLLSKVEGKSIDELITAGEEKLIAVGGAAGGGGGAAGGEEAVEEEEEEEEEEIDMGGGNLFGDNDDY